MNRLSIRSLNYQNVKMLVFDMAGTTINEKGIVYNTLYDTMKDYGLNVERYEMHMWHGANKYEVLNHYLGEKYKDDDKISTDIREQLYTNFDNNLKERYFSSFDMKFIDDKMPDLFNSLREKDIKIALNTGYSKEIQTSIIEKLHMNECIDDYISSEEVQRGRPYPYMIHKLMERHNIENPNSVMKFGDTQKDVLEGINAHCIASIGVLSGADNEKQLQEANADHILNSVMEINL